MRNITNDETNIEEGSGNSEENAIPDFIHDVSNMVNGSNVVNSSNNHNSAKRKGCTTYYTINIRKRRGGLKWEHNYPHVWIDLLKASKWPENAHQLLEIKNDVALKRL